jgi:hypothetical protein
MNNRSINWRALASHHPSAFLLAAQFFSLVLYAVLNDNPSGRAILGMFGVLVLALVIWVLKRSPAIWWLIRVLAIPSFALSLSSVLVSSQTLLMWASAMEAVLYFCTAGSLIAYMIWTPGSFGVVNHPQQRTFFELLYASFNNLSSTGSGDVVAVGPQARVLVMFEQFTGVAYIAVVVSRLIGMTIVRHRDKEIASRRE